jgi:hypothetical protein
VTRVFSARVQGGVIIAEGLDLPEGATVTVAATDDQVECDLAPEELAELDAAIREADAHDGDTMSHEQVLAELGRLRPSR